MSYLRSSYQSSIDLSASLKNIPTPQLPVKSSSSPDSAASAEFLEKSKNRPVNLLTDLNAPTPIKPSQELPARFKDPSLYKTEKSRSQHPLYQTSSSVYGARPPAAQELPTKYYPNVHEFTNTFAGGMAPSAGITTNIHKSKVVGVYTELGAR